MGCFWTDLDDQLVRVLQEDMGESGDYTDLVVEDTNFVATIIRRIEDWRDLPMPAVIVMGGKVLRDNGGHGDGDVHFDKRHPYLILIITDGTQFSAVHDAKVLEDRVEVSLANVIENARITPYTDGDERVNSIEVGDSQIKLYLKPNCKEKNHEWWAVAAVEIVVESTI